jgi:NAD(P)-dependent dehydrogenase (short-subunit alcohol dehydrogenase family)
MFDFTDRVALVTGAAGNLGCATALAFERAGARTILVDHSTERLRDRYLTLIDSPDHELAGGVDLTNPTAATSMAERAHRRFGRIDVLVNTVGTFRGGDPVHLDDLTNWDVLFRVNVMTAVHTCRAIVPFMLRQGAGRIVNVASRGALVGDAGFSAYSASKCAILRLTESLADELKGNGINVNCVLPGTIDTPQNRKALPKANHAKWIDPAAIADVIAFLASDAARAVNGASVPVFGKA